jgi:hypothetical protein
MSLAIVHDTPLQQSHHQADLSTVVADLRRRHRRANEDQLAELLATLLTEDGDLLLEAATFVVKKFVAAAEAQARRREAAPSGRERIARKVTEQAAVAEIVEKVKAAVLDLPVTLVNGEQNKLRFATGGELAQLGAAYQRIAERVGDCMVGEVLTEAEAAALLAKSS